MEINEIVKTNTEEIAENIAEASDAEGSVGNAAFLGIGILAGMLIYKYAVIPIAGRIRAKRAEKDIAADLVQTDDEYEDEDDEEDETEDIDE